MEAQLHKGDVKTAPFTASADQNAGDILGTATGIAQVVARDTDNGAVGTTYVDGLFRVTKDDGGAVNFSVGDQVDWDDTAKQAVATGGNFALGVAVEAAANVDAEVVVWLNHASLPAAAA